MSVMALGGTGLDLPTGRPLTVDDLTHTPDDGRKYELADGRLDVSPAPVGLHTLAEGRLVIHLGGLLSEEFAVLPSPGVTLNNAATSHRVPDVAVIRLDRFEMPYQTTPPVLAVEVLSPESVFRDTDRKRREYAEFGIESYWILNPLPEKPALLALRLENGAYREEAQVFGRDVFETEFPFAVRLCPEALVTRDPGWKAMISGPPQDEAATPTPGNGADDDTDPREDQ